MTVTVYSKPSYGQSDATYRALDAHGIDYYEAVDLSAEPEALDKLRRRSQLQAPVVVTDDDERSGFRTDKIDELTARHAVIRAFA